MTLSMSWSSENPPTESNEILDRLNREVESLVHQVRLLRIEKETLLKKIQSQDKIIRELTK